MKKAPIKETKMITKVTRLLVDTTVVAHSSEEAKKTARKQLEGKFQVSNWTETRISTTPDDDCLYNVKIYDLYFVEQLSFVQYLRHVCCKFITAFSGHIGIQAFIIIVKLCFTFFAVYMAYLAFK